MIPAMYSAISGLQAHQTMLNVTANNLANVDTIGFKAQRTTFESELSQLINGGASQTPSNGGTNPQQSGLGVQVGSVDQEMGQGSLQSTGNSLDVAVQGDGFLVVGGSPNTVTAPTAGTYQPALATDAAGSPTVGNANLPNSYSYTRAGNLTTDAEGFLTTANGQYVMGSTTAGGSPTGATGTYIYIPPGSSNVSISQSGQVTYTDNTAGDTNSGKTVTAGYVSLATFANDAGLTRGADTEWTTSNNSGAAQYSTAGITNTGVAATQIISGNLEQSNVDMATEFTNMIEAERGYQANSSVVSTSDQMMQTLIQMAQA